MPMSYFRRWPGLAGCAALVLLSMPVLAEEPDPAAKPPPSKEDTGYSVGLTFGSQLRASGVDEQTLDLAAAARGLKDGLAGKVLTDADRDRTRQLLMAARELVGARNRAAASAFLAQNGAIAGVVTTASGLQYTIVQPGDGKGAAPTAGDRVTVHYRGRLLDGTEFDSSDRHGESATFGLDGVVKGWREALLLMKPGAQWRIFIPPELAYGTHSPPAIPPDSLLVFDVELVKVEPPPALGAQAPKRKPTTKPKTTVPPAG
jgi:FKBP-type peptidyl-prolyl cis-trans isomerase